MEEPDGNWLVPTLNLSGFWAKVTRTSRYF
jgi:hypothetical protein